MLARILGLIAFYCKASKLPALTTLVVEKKPGRPAEGIPLDPNKVDEEREKVYGFDWYDIYPPSEEDFTAAYEARHEVS